jgi:VanZ family protein
MKKSTHLAIFIILIITGILLDLAPIEVPAGVDKVCHFTGFFVITISAITTFYKFFGTKWLNFFFILALIGGGLFAGLSEDAQKLVPVRGCDPYDWITNIGGISLACVLFFLMNSLNKSHEENE